MNCELLRLAVITPANYLEHFLLAHKRVYLALLGLAAMAEKEAECGK
jgi:hypothetical protein